MKKPRRQFSAADKVAIVKAHVVDKVYWLPVKRSVVDLAIESRLKLVESMAFVRLDF